LKNKAIGSYEMIKIKNKLALAGGAPVRTKPFPAWPVIGKQERKNLLSVFDSGKWRLQASFHGSSKRFLLLFHTDL